MDLSNVMIELLLPKKLVKHTVGGRIVFPIGCKLLFIFINGWRVLGTRHQVGAAHAIWVAYTTQEQNWCLLMRHFSMCLATLGTVARPRHVCQKSLWSSFERGFFPPSLFILSSSRKSWCQLQKKHGLGIFQIQVTWVWHVVRSK